MIISVIELTIVFDGIGQAITLLVNVYRGEKTRGLKVGLGSFEAGEKIVE